MSEATEKSGRIWWSFDRGNPVIKPSHLNGALDADVAGAGSVIRIGDTYRMFYWGSGSRKDCIHDGETTRIDVLLTDTWKSVKDTCMEAHGLTARDPNKFEIDVRQTPAMSKKVRGKTVSATVGDYDIWESRIALFPASDAESDADE